MTIAIATINPDSVPETYVRQHIRLIDPGNTVTLYFEGEGVSLKDVPSMRMIGHSAFPEFFRKLRSVYNILSSGYSGSVIGSEARRVTKFLKKHNVSTVLAEFGPTGCALAKLCRKAGIRLIVNFHGYDATVMPKRRLIRRAYRTLARDAGGFICGSKHFAVRLEELGFPRPKISVIPCGIEVDTFSFGGKKDPNLLIAVGRLTAKKAPHLTIEMFSIVQKSFPDMRLEIIGDGPLRKSCEQQIANLGLGDNIVLHGAKTHEFVKQRLSVAGVFVQHSVVAPNGDTESQGISLLEAMASAIPVVTTNHNGFSETVVQGETGFLVDEYDVQQMANEVVRLYEQPVLRRRMGELGRERVINHFTSDKLIGKLRKLLAESE